MSSSLRRGGLAAVALAFSIASLAACGAGNNAQTHQIKPDNAATTVGDVMVQNASIVTQPDRESTGPAVIVATLFNNGVKDQTLESITVDGTDKTAKLSPAKGKGPITVPAGGRVVLGGKDNASAVLASSREAVQDGNAQPVTFTFSETGKVKLKTFVVPATSYFKDWGPSQIPAAPTTKPSPGAEPSGSATPSGGETGAAGAGADEQGEQGTEQAPAGEADAGHTGGH